MSAQPSPRPAPCTCGARYSLDDMDRVLIKSDRFRVWVTCAVCGESGEPAGIRGSERQAVRLAVLNWNAEHEMRA